MFRNLAGNVADIFSLIPLLLFSAIFIIVLIYVLTDRRRAHHRAMEHMPLADGDGEPERTDAR
jgi:hypothetical protein